VPASAQSYVHFSDRMTESLMKTNKLNQDNKATLDSIQDMAVELTRAIRSLEAAAINSVRMADKVLPGVKAGLTSADTIKLKSSTPDVRQPSSSLQGLMPVGGK
jgi:hypothetical protein